jgi:hypothetical protein
MHAPATGRGPGALPWIILAVMTLAAFGGPVLIVATLAGGPHEGWPPDRPVEWAVFWGTCGVVVLLMVVGVAFSVANQRRLRARREAEGRP